MSVPTRDQFLFTESFDTLMNSNVNVMVGGNSNNTLIGEDLNFGENSNNTLIGGERKPSPGDALHQEALEYLKTTLKLKELEARAYKSIAYRHVKETSPEAKHFERAEKMLELVKNKNFIKEYKDKLEETMRILENIDSEKEKRNSETKSEEQKGGNLNFSETSVMNNYTESNANQPYYKEYMQAKNQYLQSKLQKGGNNYSETSAMNNYTESNANQPYYKEYMQAKNQYLQAKLHKGGNLNSQVNETPEQLEAKIKELIAQFAQVTGTNLSIAPQILEYVNSVKNKQKLLA